MASGAAISGSGHGIVLLGVLVGGFFSAPAEEPLAATDVSVISAEQFAALTQQVQPDPAPSAATDLSQPQPPAPEPLPETPAPEPAPETPPAPEPEPAPEPDPEPVVPEPAVPDPELQEAAPDLGQPETSVLETPVPAPLSETPAPLEAPRVAPLPVPETPAVPEIATESAPTVSPDADTDVQAEEQPPAAPEEATTEIVTEAETPGAGAVASSIQPALRPTRPSQSAVGPAPQPVPDTNSAVNEALAGALEQAQPAPSAPSGPPLTSGEKDGLRIAVQACWNTGSLSTDALNVTVVVGVEMGRDGKPDTGSIRMLSFEGGSEAAARQAFEAARRAVIRCGTSGYDLPEEKYEQWREIEMTFNPERMRIK